MDNGQGSHWEHRYDIGVIRKLLTEAFSAEELRRLCWEQPLFRPVFDRFTQTTSTDLMIDYLLEFCDRKLFFGELLSEVRERAPRQYEKYKGQFYRVVGIEPELRPSGITSISNPERGPSQDALVGVLIDEETYPLTEERQEILVSLIATVVQAPPGSVRIIRIITGSLWVGLAMPRHNAEELVKLFDTHDQDLWPLLAEFRISHIGMLPVQLPPTGLDQLGPEHISLVRLLYLGAGKVLIEQELGGGYGGAMVLLAQPINQQGRPMVRQIIKIGVGTELRSERDNSIQYIEKDLPLVAARLGDYIEWQGLSGMTYTFLGDGMLGQTRTLEAYYQDRQIPTEKIIQTLTDLLDKELGQRWFGQTTPHICFFAEEYGRYLIEHLRLKVRPASADGIWRREQRPAFIEAYKRLPGEAILPEHHQILAGTLVQVDDLKVSTVRRSELMLQLPTNPSVAVKIECQPDGDTPLTFSPGDKVVVRGEVMYNRSGRLEQIVVEAFSSFPEATVNINQDWLNWEDNTVQYPNPLRFYPKVLNQVLRGRRSMVHGDLHLRNVLVDGNGRGWLIDFAQITERHNLYDFIKLETFIRQMILGQEQYQFSFATYLQFEESLVAASLGRSATPPENPDLRRAYQVIRAVREIAAHYMGHPVSFQDEYLPALFLYNLAVLKYYDNHGNKSARLAFATAAVVGRALVESEPVILPLPSKPAEAGVPMEVQHLPEHISESPEFEMAPGPQREKIFDTAAIRDLLTIALNDRTLNDLCQDYFPEVYRDFSEGMTISKRRRLLIDYCTRHNQFQQLVRQIRKINPEQYELYFPFLVQPVTDKFKSEKDADQIQAARTLGRLGEPGAIPLLEAQLLNEPNPNVGYWLAVAIGEIGGHNAIETLERIQQQLISQGADPYTLLGIEDAQNLAETK
jgi:hypothetical protein